MMGRPDGQQEFMDRYGKVAIDLDAVWQAREVQQQKCNSQAYRNAEPTAIPPRPAHELPEFNIPKKERLK
tara:strand:+ start:4823 stop:5032 length:210 start_codon:yes stop_codon:yes gene_type:complete